MGRWREKNIQNGANLESLVDCNKEGIRRDVDRRGEEI
jgi:hypothetical protein